MRAVLVAVLLAACGGETAKTHTGHTGTPPIQGTYDAATFVEDAAQGWCGAVRDCEPGTWAGTHGGDQATCLASERARWQAEVDDMACEFDVDAAVYCVNSLATTACEAWEAGTTQARCEAVTSCP